MKKRRLQDDEKVLSLYVPQYAMWLKDFFGIGKSLKITKHKNFMNFVKKCCQGESEEYEDHTCWEITQDYDDVSANRRILVKTKFIIGKMHN